MMQFCPQCAAPLTQRLLEGRPRPACPACGFIAYADPKVAATALIERAGKLLFIRRAIDPGRGRWCFPGGYVDFGEDPLHAAARECWEEAGLEVFNLQLLDVVFDGRVIVIMYLGEVTAEAEAQPGDDADLAAWLGPDELPPLAFPNLVRPIELWKHRTQKAQNV